MATAFEPSAALHLHSHPRVVFNHTLGGLHTHTPTVAPKSPMIWVAEGCGQTVTTATRSRAKFAPLA